MTTPITRRDVIAHQSVVPWPSQIQVEQDLLLCRAMAVFVADKFLQGQIAMRRRHVAAQGSPRAAVALQRGH